MAPERNGNGWSGEDRRAYPSKEGWTLWREVWGTFLGALPALLMAGAAILRMYSEVEVHSVELSHLKEADIRHELALAQQRGEMAAQRNEILNRLEGIGRQMESVQQTVANMNGRLLRQADK